MPLLLLLPPLPFLSLGFGSSCLSHIVRSHGKSFWQLLPSERASPFLSAIGTWCQTEKWSMLSVTNTVHLSYGIIWHLWLAFCCIASTGRVKLCSLVTRGSAHNLQVSRVMGYKKQKTLEYSRLWLLVHLHPALPSVSNTHNYTHIYAQYTANPFVPWLSVICITEPQSIPVLAGSEATAAYEWGN